MKYKVVYYLNDISLNPDFDNINKPYYLIDEDDVEGEIETLKQKINVDTIDCINDENTPYYLPHAYIYSEERSEPIFDSKNYLSNDILDIFDLFKYCDTNKKDYWNNTIKPKLDSVVNLFNEVYPL